LVNRAYGRLLIGGGKKITEEDKMFIIYRDAPYLVRLELTKDMPINYAKFDPVSLYEKHFHTPKHAVREWAIYRPVAIQLFTERDKDGSHPLESSMYLSSMQPDQRFTVVTGKYGGINIDTTVRDNDRIIEPHMLPKLSLGDRVYVSFDSRQEHRDVPFNISRYFITKKYTASYKQRDGAYDILDLND
jgi:hypothetical protein